MPNDSEYIKPKYSDFAQLFGPGDVPGYLTDGDMSAIAEISQLLPAQGLVVEVGSFLGKSSVEWAKNLPGHTIICIDSFNAPIDILQQLLIAGDFVPPEDVHDNLSMFRHYTKDYPNIRPVQVFFNDRFDFPAQADLVFEDSTHTLKYLNQALPFWWSHVKAGGILAGHDYSREVAAAVDIFAALNNLSVNTFEHSSIWYIKK